MGAAGSLFRQYSRTDKDMLRGVRERDLQLFNDALQRGADINRKFDYNWSALHWASFKGEQTMVEILVDRGAKQRKNNDKNTPADICCYDTGGAPDRELRNRILQILQDARDGPAARHTAADDDGL